MYRDKTTAVVVPAYNESGNVGEVIETAPDYVDRIYAVDDGSDDDTWTEIREHASARNQADDGPYDRVVVPIRHEANTGVGGAIKTGYRHAREDDIDAVAVMGGDGQMDPEKLDRFLDPVVAGDAHYAKGNRLLRHEDWVDVPPFRMFGTLLLTLLTRVASGYWGIGDPQNGYTVISREALETIDVDRLYDEYGFSNDLLIELNIHGFTVVDVARSAQYSYDREWSSDIQYSRFIPTVSVLLARGFARRLLATRGDDDGLHGACYAVGIGAMAGGSAGATADLTRREGASTGWGKLLLLGALAFVIGIVLDHAAHRDLQRKLFGTEDEATAEAEP